MCNVCMYIYILVTWNQDCWKKHQQLQICRWYHSNGRKGRGTNEPLDEGERGEWKSGLKTQHSKNVKMIASSSNTSWQIGKMWKQWDFIFLGFKIIVDSVWSYDIKRLLLLARKARTNLDSILKSRDTTLPTKVQRVKLWFFQKSCMDVRVGPLRKLSANELMLSNCGVGENSWGSLGLQGDPTSPS